MPKNNISAKIEDSESTISMFLGIIVVIVIGILLFNYFRGLNKNGQVGESGNTENNQPTITEEEKEAGKTFTGNLPTTYKVSKGDDLWDISIKFFGSGYNWVDIAKANNIKNSDLLFVDQELTIPDVEVKKPLVVEVKPGSTQSNVISESSYTVQKGDTLWNISVRAYQDGYKWPQIAKANNLLNPEIIHPGNTLTIPR